MVRRWSDSNVVAVSVRLIDDSILVGTVSCGASGKLETLLGSDVKFIDFVSKDGHQRFIAQHQIASIEVMGIGEIPTLPALNDYLNSYELLGLTPEDNLETAMAMYQDKIHIYKPERWMDPGFPPEFARYAAQRSKQFATAFTIVKAEIQAKSEARKRPSGSPLFGFASTDA